MHHEVFRNASRVPGLLWDRFESENISETEQLTWNTEHS